MLTIFMINSSYGATYVHVYGFLDQISDHVHNPLEFTPLVYIITHCQEVIAIKPLAMNSGYYQMSLS